MIQKSNMVLYITIFAWLCLALLVIFSVNRFVMDESVYYQNLSSEYPPLSIRFIKNYKGTAGIVSTWFHLLAMGITQGNIIRMRIFNLFWLFLTVLLFNKSLVEEEKSTWRFLGFTIVLSPYIFQMTARVMGDYPTFFFGFAFYVLFNKLETGGRKWYWYLITGLCGAIAIAGKQTFIFLLCFPVYSMLTNKQNLGKKLLLLLSTCALPAYIYWAWGGLLPRSSSFALDSGGFTYKDIVYAFTVFAATAIVFSYSYMKELAVSNFKKILIGVIIIHVLFGIILPSPMFKHYSRESDKHGLLTIFSGIWSFIMLFLSTTGFIFFYQCCKKIYKSNLPLVMFVGLWFAVFLRIPHFQGRYLALMAPFTFLIIFKAGKINITPFSAITGFVLNLVTMIIQYHVKAISSNIRDILKIIGLEKL